MASSRPPRSRRANRTRRPPAVRHRALARAGERSRYAATGTHCTGRSRDRAAQHGGATAPARQSTIPDTTAFRLRLYRTIRHTTCSPGMPPKTLISRPSNSATVSPSVPKGPRVRRAVSQSEPPAETSARACAGCVIGRPCRAGSPPGLPPPERGSTWAETPFSSFARCCLPYG